MPASVSSSTLAVRAGLVVGVTHLCSAGRAGGGQGGREKGAGGAQEEAEKEEEEVMIFLRALVSGSHLFFVFLPEEYSCRFSGSSFRICRILRFLVRQWIHVISSLRRLLYSDPAFDPRLALLFCVDSDIGLWASFAGVDALRAMFSSFVTENSAMLGPRWYMLCVSLRSGGISCLSSFNMWTTDPQVDPRLSGHVLGPLVSDSHLYGIRVCLWSTRLWIFRGMTPGMVSIFNTLWFDSGYSWRQFMRLL